jgi:hypothetical protein
MSRKPIIFSLAIITASLVMMSMTSAYKGDAKFEVFMNDLDALTDEVVDEIEGNPTLAGVIAAQQILDAKKARLKKEYADLKAADGARVHWETLLNFVHTIDADTNQILLLLDNPAVVQAARNDSKFKVQLLKLVADHKSLTE